MQTHGGEAAEAAITRSERTFLHEILVDWNQDGNFDHPLSDLSEYMDEIELDRQLAGTAPAEILLIEGNAAAELSFTVSGDYNGLPLTGVFSPYNAASPFFGKEMVGAEITYRIGVETPMGVVWYPQFVGNVRIVTPQRADNTVEISALDRVEKLRKPVLLPPWAMSDIHVNFGEVDSQLCRSHWVIDHCLRHCDVSVSGKRPITHEEFLEASLVTQVDEGEGLVFFVTGNGSYLPTVGYLDNPSAMTFPMDGIDMYTQTGPRHPDTPETSPRPLALAALGTPIRESGPNISPPEYQGVIRYWMETRDIERTDNTGPFSIRPIAGHYFGFTINTNGPNGNLYRTVDRFAALEIMLGHYFTLYVEIEKGRIRPRFRRHRINDYPQVDIEGSWVTLPTGVDHIDVFCVWDMDYNNGFEWRMTLNDYDTGWQNTGKTAEVPWEHYDGIGGRVTIGQALSLSDVFYSSRAVQDPAFVPERAIRTSTYRAELDIGKNRFTSMPYTDPKEAWEIITSVAAAEMGAVFWDEEGVFRFWNLDTIQEKQGTVVRRLSLDEASDLVISNSLDSVRNIYTVKANRRRAVIGRTIFEADDVQQFYVPARSIRHFRVWADDAQSPLPFKVTRHLSAEGLGAPYWDDSVVGGYCVQFFQNNQWAERPEFVSGVDINGYFTRDGAMIVRIWNGYNLPARLASGITNANEDRSSPAFRLSGTQIIDDPDSTIWVRHAESIEKYGPRNLELSGDWYQDTVQGSVLIEQLISRTSIPTPVTDAIEIAGDPRLQLGDTIALFDPDGLGRDVRLQILGINRRFSRDGGLRDTLTVEMINPSGRPPIVDAGDDITLTVGERRKLVGSYLDYGAPNVVTQWKILSGPDRVDEIKNGDTFDFIPTAVGQYVLEFSLSSDYGSASDTLVVTAVPQSTGGGGPVGRPGNPGEALWIGREGGNWYNIGLGHPTGHVDYNYEKIRDWDFTSGELDLLKDRWYLNDDGNVEFRVKITDGRTSNNTKFPRTELREFKENGDPGSSGRAAWNGSSGTHWMKGRSRVKQVSRLKPWVCFFQIHDADSDLIRVQTEHRSNGSLFLNIRYTPNDSGGSELKQEALGSYQLGQWVDWYIEVKNGRCRIVIDGQEVFNRDNMGRSGCYFKHGAYAQSSVNDKYDSENGDGNQWFVVETESGSFQTWHDDYEHEPAIPDWMVPTEPVPTEPFRRLYLSNAASDYQPGETPEWDPVWWDIQRSGALSARALTELPAGAPQTVTLTETTNGLVYGLTQQFISGPADAPGVLTGQVQVCVGAAESNANADMTVVGLLYILEGDTTEVRGGRAFGFYGAFELDTVSAAWQIFIDLWSETNNAPWEQTFEAGDRLVLELGFGTANASTTPYTFTMHYGGDGVRDLQAHDTDMTLPGWFAYQTSGGSFGGASGVIGGPGSGDNDVDGVQAAVVHNWGPPLEEWSDEFEVDGPPDPLKWDLPGEDWEGHGGNGRRRPERQEVIDGKLVMTGLANGDSGWMESLYNSQGGGRWEVRARSYMGAPSAGEPATTSNGNDYHPVILIWPESNSRSQDGEYDFMENSRPGDTKAVAFMHYPDDDDEDQVVQQERFERSGVDLSEWHNFAFEYKQGQDGYVRGYLDGEFWFEHTGGGGPAGRRDIQDMPAGHLNIQLDNFDGVNQTPATLEVAWVRIYDHEYEGDPGGGPGGGGSIESFGNGMSGRGSQDMESGADKLVASSAVATASGKLVAGHSRLWILLPEGWPQQDVTTKARMCVYSNSGGQPGTRLAVSDEITLGTGDGLVRNFTFSGSNQINITQGTTYFIGVMWDDPSPGSGQTGAAYPQVQLSRATSGTRWENGSGYSYPNQPSSWTGGASSSGPIDAWLDVLVPD